MSKRSSADIGCLLVDGYDLLGVSTDLEDTVEALFDDTTAFGDAWTEQAYAGLRKGTISQKGFYDDATDSVNDALAANTGVSRVLVYGLEQNTVGRHFIGYAGALETRYERIAALGKLHRANASYVGSGQVEEGVVLHAHAAETADGDTTATSVDNAAQTTAGGAVYLQVSALTLGGFDDLLVTVQDSADDVTYADLQAFAAVSSAPAAQRVARSGTIRRYAAVAWTFEGAGSGQSATFLVGLVRN